MEGCKEGTVRGRLWKGVRRERMEAAEGREEGTEGGRLWKCVRRRGFGQGFLRKICRPCDRVGYKTYSLLSWR